MSTISSAPDRRAGIKARHRKSIVEAATSIMEARLSSDFSVDELASAADVSRRTIFNHFASMNDVIIEVCGNELGVVVEQLASIPPAAAGIHRSMFDELAATVRETDLIGPMVYLTRLLGSDDPELSTRQLHMASRAFAEISGRLGSEMRHRHPDADPLDIHLLVSSMTNGLMVMYGHWISVAGTTDSNDSRELWGRLLERLVESLRNGFGAL